MLFKKNQRFTVFIVKTEQMNPSIFPPSEGQWKLQANPQNYHPEKGKNELNH